MSVPTEPGTAFEVIEPEAVFEFAVVVFDPSADLGQPHQVTQSNVCWEGG
jgi:hypothetical protein